VDDQRQESWKQQGETARSYDSRECSWSPPSFGALVTAARASTLQRFYPFTSHGVLRFRTNEQMPGDMADIAPGSIALGPDGVYQVQSGRTWAASATIALTTTDPAKAVAELERLLATWDQQDPDLRLPY